MKVNEIIYPEKIKRIKKDLRTAIKKVPLIGDIARSTIEREERQEQRISKIKKMLPRLKEIVSVESQNTADMWNIYWQWGTASKEEKKFANNQIKILLKTAGLAGIIVLPGTPFILPALVKLAKKAGIDILPKWADGGNDEIK